MGELKTYTAKIYTLSTLEGQVFYVGVTVKTVEERVAGHMTDAKAGCPKAAKSLMLKKLNYKFTATIIDAIDVTAASAKEAVKLALPLEEKWINKHLELGCDLCNCIAVAKTIKVQNKSSYRHVNHSIY